jgi:Na+-driven multidrug efflux pump
MRRLQIVTGLVPMLTNVILNLWWIPLYGAEGAAWATVVSYLLAPAIPFLYPAVWRRLASFTAVSN